MDNLSHTLASLAAAEILHRMLPGQPATDGQAGRRRLLLTSCALAGNFPDLDLVLTPLLPEPLGYLLHHRGHTHTVLAAIPQALLLAVVLWLSWPGARRLLQQSRIARFGMAAALGIGFGLHFTMDYLNSYGIHPFHPFDSRWYYGDMVFILEPVFWVVFSVPLLLMLPIRAAASGIALTAAGLGTLGWKGYLSGGSLLAMAIAGTLLFILHRAGSRHDTRRVLPVAAAFAFGLGFVVVQAFAHREAADMLAARFARSDPSQRLHDIALTPFPSNPACWMFVSISSSADERHYQLRRGLLSLLPAGQADSMCPEGFMDGKKFDADAATGSVLILSSHDGSLTELRRLAKTDCHLQAWLRFARMPWLDQGVASDLRYASAMRTNFTAMRLDAFEGRPCPEGVPSWDMPRSDLIAE